MRKRARIRCPIIIESLIFGIDFLLKKRVLDLHKFAHGYISL